MKTIQFEFQLTLKVKMKAYLPSPQQKLEYRPLRKDMYSILIPNMVRNKVFK